MSTSNDEIDKIKEQEHQWKKEIADNIDKGESVYAVYKGEALQRLSGKMTNEEALALGHFDGLTNITLSTIKTTEDGLNKLSSLPPDLVPIVKRIKKINITTETRLYKTGMAYVTDKIEAESLGRKEGYTIKKIDGLYYFEYPGLVIRDRLMTDFTYSIARASGSLGGETKLAGFEALSNIHVVPSYNMGGFGSQWGEPTESDDEEE